MSRPACACAVIVLAALSSGAAAQSECKRVSRTIPEGETLTLSETSKFPCRLEIVNTTTALRGDANDAIGDFGNYVARGPDGRFYTSSRTAELYVWSPSGNFIRTLGRKGGGPGEFSGGGVFIDFTRNGQMYVGDADRWSLFSPALEYVKSIPASITGNGVGDTGFLTAEGLFMGSGARVAMNGNSFTLFDLGAADGNVRVVRSFGGPGARRSRRISPSASMNFWAAPSDGTNGGYTLELWRTDGTHLRTVRRNVPWFETDAEGKVPPPEIEMVHDDGTGIVFVTVMAPNVAAWKASSPRPDRAAMNGMINIYVEAIDGNSGTVLASWGPRSPSEAQATMPLGMFPRSRTGYRRDESPDGFGIMRIVELKLVAN